MLCSSLQHVLNLLSLLCLHQSLSGNDFQRRRSLNFHVYGFMSSLAVAYHCSSLPDLNGFQLPNSQLSHSPTNILHSSALAPLKVKVTLRLTVSQSVSLLGLKTRYLLLFDSYGLIFWGAPSLTRGRVCLLYMLLALAR
jgi:hypothetical protein